MKFAQKKINVKSDTKVIVIQGPVTLVLVQIKGYIFHILLDCMEWSLVVLWLVHAV